jgi:aryl-alcohol dehydrogenase-like predicted oxidoreductase
MSVSSFGEIPTRPFGRTGLRVSILGLGGWHLGIPDTDQEAVRLAQAAIDAGVTFMDNAWDYNDGLSERRMGKALVGRRDRVVLMTKACPHGRDARVAMRQLEESLKRLRTDYLDLWQLHEVVYDDEPSRYFAKGGAVEALDKAKRQGKVRFVGFTGHKDPRLHLEMLAHDYPWDAVQLPLNCFDGQFRSFEQQVLPEINRRGIAAIGMKALGGDGAAVRQRVVSAEDALAYALSLPIATLVTGIDSSRVLRQGLRVARGFAPMSERRRETMRRRVRRVAMDGRYELYKISAHFDGPEARRQHGIPSAEEVAR